MTTAAVEATNQAPSAPGAEENEAGQVKQMKVWQPTEKQVLKIAQICHEANRAVCVTNDDLSQPSWDEAPDWQKTSAINGVLFHIAHPHANPRDSHDNWMAEKLRAGWTYGPTKDANAKTHPCLLPYSQLPMSERVKDQILSSIVAAYLRNLRSDPMGGIVGLL